MTNLKDGQENSCEVVVIQQEDINEDVNVNIIDIALAALNYNKPVNQNMELKKYDLNGDGRIDILDLVKISKCIN